MANEHPQLIHVNDDQPGYSRKKWGRGFIYFDEDGAKIEDKATIQRIKDLVIPPNWDNVWICSTDNGHLQSTGYDIKKRKQYIYHPIWIEYNQKNKFSRLKIFGEKLPEIRRQIEKDLSSKEWSKSKVLALIVCILDEYYLRIGNEYYAKKNDTYGLTTIRRKHIEESSKGIELSFTAKSNKERELSIEDDQLADLIKEMSDLPGYEVFRYKAGYRNWSSIDSEDVNLYIKNLVDEDFTAKYFRTWGGTKLAVELLPEARIMVEENKRLSLSPTLVKLVAEKLGNTPSVCKDYYIHPKVLEALIEREGKSTELDLKSTSDYLDPSEEFILKLI